MRNVKLMTQARFAKQGEALAAVALPHTWNAFDGQPPFLLYSLLGGVFRFYK